MRIPNSRRTSVKRPPPAATAALSAPDGAQATTPPLFEGEYDFREPSSLSEAYIVSILPDHLLEILARKAPLEAS